MRIYVAVALHNTGHGLCATPLIVTPDIQKALETARSVEQLGFEFYDDETGVVIYALEEDRPYRKTEFKTLSTVVPESFPAVFFRTWRKNEGAWREDLVI